jgi:endoglucanase
VHRGINIGNALDNPPATMWRVRERDLDVIADAGFDTVRLPVRWSAHAAATAPFEIEPSFLSDVASTVDDALARHLDVIVDMHHYDELCLDAVRHRSRFLALWGQIAARFCDHPEEVTFELLNEPNEPMTPERWNELLRDGLATVRRVDAERTVIIGPATMNTLAGLPFLDLPDDAHLMLAIHYYLPFAFTHQGAPWSPGAHEWLGTTWGSDDEHLAVHADLEMLAAWAAARDVPVVATEFGTYRMADLESRVAWTTTVRSILERLGIGWCYWDFDTDFGAFDPSHREWREPLRAALLDP